MEKIIHLERKKWTKKLVCSFGAALAGAVISSRLLRQFLASGLAINQPLCRCLIQQSFTRATQAGHNFLSLLREAIKKRKFPSEDGNISGPKNDPKVMFDAFMLSTIYRHSYS